MQKYSIHIQMQKMMTWGQIPSKETSNDCPEKEAVCDNQKHPRENSHEHHLQMVNMIDIGDLG